MPADPISLGLGAASLLSGLFNKKKAAPTVPFVPVDVSAEQKKAVEGNLGAEGDIEKLLNQSNRFQQEQATSLMEQALPGFGNLQKRFTGLTNELLTNPYDLPKDVEQNLARLAAERGVATGTRGEFNDFSLLRDFGINSLQYGQSRIGQAQSLFQTLGSLAPRVNPMSPMSFYVTPGEAIQTQMTNNQTTQAVNQAGANAQTAARNWNTQNLWQGITDALALGGGIFGSPSGNQVSGGLRSSSIGG